MTQRTREVAWVLDHLDDLEADFLRFYRLDTDTLTGPRYFRLAHRVSAYGGVMTARVNAEQQQPGVMPTPSTGEQGVTHVPATSKAALGAHDAFAGLID